MKTVIHSYKAFLKPWLALGLSICAAPALADSGTFVISPYLFSVLGNQIGVAWQYTVPPKGAQAVQFTSRIGETPAIDVPAQQDGDLYFAILPLPACGFGKTASYQVSGQPAPLTIQEIPCADSPDPVRFSFLADTQEGVDHDVLFAQQMAAFPSQAVLNGGDLVQTGTKMDDWVAFFKSMEPVGSTRVLFPAVGNHEYRDDLSVPMWKHFFQFEARDAHYSYDLGAAHIIVLNSNFEDDPTQKTSQLAWLEAELARPSQWRIVYFHHPGYSVGFFNSPEAPKKEYETVQSLYIPLFEKYHVDIVMNGHVHLFETAIKNGIHYLTVGPAGGSMGVMANKDPYKLKASYTRSIVNLEASPGHLRALSTSIEGNILDDLILMK